MTVASTPGRPGARAGACVILPVMNEERNIEPMLEGICRELADRPYHVCLIDDGSSDQTVPKVRAAMAANPRVHLIQRTKTQRGSVRGSALKAGLEWGLRATGDEVFIEMDGDLSHRPEELRPAIERVARDECDVVIASKYMPGSLVHGRPLGRHAVSRLCSFLVSRLISSGIKDYSNGYRFYHRRAARLIAEHEIHYASPIYLTEALAIWLRGGLRVVEVPSTYVGRQEGLSKLRLIDLAKAGLAVFEISYRYHWRGFRRLPSAAAAAPGEGLAGAA
jgi:dolichol-phosphate mannosyltransferase